LIMEFSNSAGVEIVQNMIAAVKSNKEFLSEIDGEIGDGDHGINMNKGFSIVGEQLSECSDMSAAFALLSKTLLTKIGGSMGPLYGTIFSAMAKASADYEQIDVKVVEVMLSNALKSIEKITTAKPGDKTLMDVLVPAQSAYSNAVSEGADLKHALERMCESANAGFESTKDMVAKIGRASRLGERSKGVYDAGAASCKLLLVTMAKTMMQLAK